MKHTSLFLLLILLLGLTACSKPADRTLMNYEQSLSHADSLVQCGVVDSARAVRLISGLHREYNQIKELSDGRHVRLKPVSGYERFFWGVFSVIMFSISGAMLFSLIRFKKERSHRNYFVTLSENEQRLRNNEREREELEECLKEMSLTDEEREEVHSSLMNLMEHGSRLDKENESLRARLKEYEDNPVPRELELLRKEGERVRMLDGQVSAVWGTHTHVPTADTMILPQGTGYVTDLGMTGPRDSVLGIRPELSIRRFRGDLPSRYEPAPGPCKLEACLFTIDDATGRCTAVRRVDIHG